MNRIAHDLSPYAGIRDPIISVRRAQVLANVLSRTAAMNASGSIMQWDRRGSINEEPDPRANVAMECGWPRNPTPELYGWLYLTDAIAARVVEFIPKSAWRNQPWVFEKEKGKVQTPFDKSWQALNTTLRGGEENGFQPTQGHALFSDLKLADIYSGIDGYGGVYLMFDDEQDPREPVAGLEETGSRPEPDPKAKNPPKFSANGDGQPGTKRWRMTRNAAQTKGRQLLATQALPQLCARVALWETNDQSPRYGWPVLYQVSQLLTGQGWTGSTPPIRSIYVHWTRFLHYAPNHESPSLDGFKALANSRCRAVLPELLDGRKISGADGMAFWRNAMLKIFLETDPQLGGDVLFNKAEAQDEFEQMMNGLQQWMFLRGTHANPVAPALVDPSPHQDAKIERICMRYGWPKRVFQGSERGELASSQDQVWFNSDIQQHEEDYESPAVVAPAVNRLVLCGVLERWGDDEKGYKIEWPPVGIQDEEKKSKILLARTQALVAYVGGNGGHVVPERDWLIDEWGLSEEKADAYLDAAEQAIADEEQQAQQLADKHGMVPTVEGFEHPPPPPEPPAPIKVKPGERLVQPKQPTNQ